MQMNDPLEFSPWQNNPLDWMTRELNKKNAKLKGYTPRYNKSVPFDRIFKYDTNVVTKNPASVNYMKPFSFDLTYTKMNTERPKLVDKYVNNSTNKRLRIADRMRKMVGNVKVNRAVDMSNIPSEEQDKVLKILGMTESQLKDTPPENYFGTRIGRTGAKEQVIYNFDLWMQYPVLNQDPSHLELNERYRINYAYGSPLVMGSIQARTIWIQKSVYKPINWNDVDKGNVENRGEIVQMRAPNPLDATSIPHLVPPIQQSSPTNEPEESDNPIVEEPSSIQITENNIPHASDELTDREVYKFCNVLINTYKRCEPFQDVFKRFFGKYDKNTNRMRSFIVDTIKKELELPQPSSKYVDLFNTLQEIIQDKEYLLKLYNKLESKRGDIGRDAFWEYCKMSANHTLYYTDNIDIPIRTPNKRPNPNLDFNVPLPPPQPPQEPPDL